MMKSILIHIHLPINSISSSFVVQSTFKIGMSLIIRIVTLLKRKKHFIKMFKDVGMVVPKIRETRCGEMIKNHVEIMHAQQ